MLFYNEDWIHFVQTRYRAGVPASKEALREYIYSLKGTQITDFVMNVNERYLQPPPTFLKPLLTGIF